ncbi:hypothetical protein L6452_37166 [Arctium lappa]|uniref:Uncharacterized protein n=1 Tax=Arctium lappa TaxID=4217 RepID=A0ACB8Y3S3_ARCLA|nr:hypothetical protein L6452_37166 [Arctium lappa]
MEERKGQSQRLRPEAALSSSHFLFMTEKEKLLDSVYEVEKNDADHGAGSQAIPEVVCKKGLNIEGWKLPSPGGVSVSVGERTALLKTGMLPPLELTFNA